jgi:hypothetical protein
MYPWDNPFGFSSLFGVKVVSSPLVQPVAKLSIRASFEWCTDEFRQEMDAWLKERFGAQKVAMVMPNANTMAVSPDVFDLLKGLTHG